MATVYDAVAVAVQTPGVHGTAGLPVHLWGAPGIGKSGRIHALVKRLAAKLPGGLHCETIVASLRGAEDAAGWPKVIESKRADGSTYAGLEMIPAGWALRCAHADRAVVFLDELSTAEQATQKGFLRSVCEGVVGDLILPPTVAWVAASNEAKHAADGHTLSAAMANRWIHLDVPSPTPEEWGAYMLGGSGVDPEPMILDLKRWVAEFRKVRALGAQYMVRNSGQLHDVPDEEEAQGKAWASPRTWEIGLRGYAAGLAVGSPEISLMLLCGAVGKAGVEFAAWAQDQDLPDPIALLKGTATFTVDRARPDRAIVTLSTAAAAAVEIPTAAGPDGAKERAALVDAWYGLALIASDAGCIDVAVTGAIALSRRWQGGLGPKGTLALGKAGLGKLLIDSGIMRGV